jgi:hypothetical protein
MPEEQKISIDGQFLLATIRHQLSVSYDNPSLPNWMQPKEEQPVSDDWTQFEKDCDSMEKELWNEPTGTPPVSVSVEEAAKDYLKKIDEEDCMWTEDDEQIVKHFALFHKQQSVSVDDAAKNKFNSTNFFTGKGELYSYKEGAKFGANWQKEQNKELIKELLEALKLSYNNPFTGKSELEKGQQIESAIEKANNYLKC